MVAQGVLLVVRRNGLGLGVSQLFRGMTPTGSKRGLIMVVGSLGLTTDMVVTEYRLGWIESMAPGRTSLFQGDFDL